MTKVAGCTLQGARRSQGFAVLLFLVLTACATSEPQPVPPPPEPVPSEAEAPPAPRLPLPPPPKPTPPVARAPAALPPTAQQAPPVPEENKTPERLIGLDQGQTEDLLGQPGERAEAAPATIWRYTGRSCALDIYFYLDLQSKVMRVLHYEVRREDPAEQRPERCFSDLVAQHQSPAQSAADTDRPR